MHATDAPQTALEIEPGSYRDRNGRVYYGSDAVYRGLSVRALAEWDLLSARAFFRRMMAAGKLVATERVGSEHTPGIVLPAGWAGFLKHQRIPFISYPYEWSFGMLQDAGLLQLELLAAALNEDIVLKDGSAFNVQWLGARPVFIDIPSFEKVTPGEPWVGYRQFCQTCLYPLFLQAYKNVAFQPWLRGCIDGIEPEQCKNLMSLRDLVRRGVFKHVYLHAKLQARYAGATRVVKSDLRSAGFHKSMIQANVAGMQSLVQRLCWNQAKSTWSDYATTHSYSDADLERKAAFIRDVSAVRRRRLVWDLGCNTGRFARLAAENADHVVAMDADHLAIERLYQSLKSEGNGTILPLVSNLVDASPNLGWRGLERKAVTARAKPDLTLALALIHHIVIGANVPVAEFIDWLAGLTSELVIEFVTKGDPMVQTLLRNKRDDYADYEIDVFERCLAGRFEVARREMLASGTRVLYHALAKPLRVA